MPANNIDVKLWGRGVEQAAGNRLRCSAANTTAGSGLKVSARCWLGGGGKGICWGGLAELPRWKNLVREDAAAEAYSPHARTTTPTYPCMCSATALLVLTTLSTLLHTTPHCNSTMVRRTLLPSALFRPPPSGFSPATPPHPPPQTTLSHRARMLHNRNRYCSMLRELCIAMAAAATL